MIGQVARFGLVGAGATFVHMVVASSAILFGISPLAANFIAFVFAFSFSFTGHFVYTFHGQPKSPWRALLRFLIVAVSGFLLNQCALFAILQTAGFGAFTSVLVSTSTVATFLFFVSRSRVFV